MKKLFVLTLIFFTSFTFSMYAQNISRIDNSTYNTLKTADIFFDTAIGESAETPKEIKAFQIILNSKNADSLFKKLLKEAKPAGKLYALCGLYFTDNNFFKKESEKLLNSSKKVKIMIGCILYDEKISEITKDIINGYWPNKFKKFKIPKN